MHSGFYWKSWGKGLTESFAEAHRYTQEESENHTSGQQGLRLIDASSEDVVSINIS